MVPRIQPQDGLALIIVMLIVAIASTASVAMLSRQHLDIRRTSNTLYHGQANLYAMAVEKLAKQLLAEDLKNNKTDDLGEFGLVNKIELPVEGGFVSGYIEDLNRGFNLNNLLKTGAEGKEAEAMFKRLLKNLQLREELSGAIIDWLDSDQNVRFPDGAEDDYYQGLQPIAYRTSGQPMLSPSELLQIKGLSRQDYDILLPHVTALPEDATININTATEEVLSSLAEGISVSDIKTTLKDREKDPYTDVNDLLSDPLFAGKNVKADGLGVSSKYFVLYAEAVIGHIIRKHTAQLDRVNENTINTLMRLEGEL